jgi:hypothetical protein
MFVLKEMFNPAVAGVEMQNLVLLDRCRIWNENYGQVTILDQHNKVACDDSGRLVQCDFADGSSISRYDDHVISIDSDRGAWFFGKQRTWSPLN